MKLKFFYEQSSTIYGGLKGAFDYGPYGCNIKNNILRIWRKLLLQEEDMLEVDCSILTSADVMKSSGHVNSFNDFAVKDKSDGIMYRCDHLIKNFLSKNHDINDEKVTSILTKLSIMDAEELMMVIKQYNIRGPRSGGELSEPRLFNLMFSVDFASDLNQKCYLRPETSQGIFVNFQQLSRIKQNKLPFGVGQIGTAFRNEISPEHKLFRAREFHIAEIEYFYNPRDTKHDRFHEVAGTEINVWSAMDQNAGVQHRRMTLQDMINEELINETHGYFLGKISEFLIKVGVNKELLRFRQHNEKERAHYATSCWDAECLSSLGWIECVGCSDRGDYDLRSHSEHCGESLQVELYVDQPGSTVRTKCTPASKDSLNEFKSNKKHIERYLKKLSQEQIKNLRQTLESDWEVSVKIDDNEYIIKREMIKFTDAEKVVSTEKIFPHVIEPSFGIGRIIQVILEHNFHYREDDEQRVVLTLPADVAPYHCSILPLLSKSMFQPCVNEIKNIFKEKNISFTVDKSNESIGRRYSRLDQIGVPFAITVDYDSIGKTEKSVTIRERDSMEQVRVEILELPQIMFDLLSKHVLWQDLCMRYKPDIEL